MQRDVWKSASIMSRFVVSIASMLEKSGPNRCSDKSTIFLANFLPIIGVESLAEFIKQLKIIGLYELTVIICIRTSRFNSSFRLFLKEKIW